jgi:hypothetical protein
MIENTFQYNHTTKIEIEKTFQNTGNPWKHRRTPLLVGEGSAAQAQKNSKTKMAENELLEAG